MGTQTQLNLEKIRMYRVHPIYKQNVVTQIIHSHRYIKYSASLEGYEAVNTTRVLQ